MFSRRLIARILRRPCDRFYSGVLIIVHRLKNIGQEGSSFVVNIENLAGFCEKSSVRPLDIFLVKIMVAKQITLIIYTTEFTNSDAVFVYIQ